MVVSLRSARARGGGIWVVRVILFRIPSPPPFCMGAFIFSSLKEMPYTVTFIFDGLDVSVIYGSVNLQIDAGPEVVSLFKNNKCRDNFRHCLLQQAFPYPPPALCVTYSDDRQHSAGKAVLCAIREIAVGTATGAVTLHEDVFRGHACIQKLTAVRFHQVQMHAGSEVGVAGCPGRQKQHGIFFFDWVGIIDLAEKVGSIGKLRGELIADLLSHGVAALADSRADGCYQMCGPAPKFNTHASDTCLGNAPDCATPSSMEGRHCAPPAICHQHRNAVRGLDAQQKAGFGGHHAIALRNRFFSADDMNDCRMDLL